jgi:hypothetical protein
MESLLARIEMLEARIEMLEALNPKPSCLAPAPYYENWGAPYKHKELVVSDLNAQKQHGSAMFDGIYHMIPKLTCLQKLTMTHFSGVIPDISKIRNASVSEIQLCERFDFIPYLDNFPSLRQVQIVADTPTNPDKLQHIYAYCAEHGIVFL